MKIGKITLSANINIRDNDRLCSADSFGGRS